MYLRDGSCDGADHCGHDVGVPALLDFRRGLRVRLLQLAADILGGFLSAHDHRHLDRNARMAARIWQANRGVMARGSGSGAVRVRMRVRFPQRLPRPHLPDHDVARGCQGRSGQRARSVMSAFDV